MQSSTALYEETANILLGKTAGSVKELGKQAQLSKRDLNDLAGGLELVNPQLGMLARMGINAKEALGVMLTPMGAAIGGAVAAVGLLTKEIEAIIESGRQAEEAWNKATEAQRKYRESQGQRTEELADVLTRAGISPTDEALGRARAIERRFVREGIDVEPIRKALPLLIDESLTDEQRLDIIGAAEFGETEFKTGTERDRARTRRAIDRELRKRPELREARRQNYVGQQAREQIDIQQGDVGAIARELVQTGEFTDVESARPAAEDIARRMKEGKVGETASWYWTRGQREEAEMALESRERDAASRAQRIGADGADGQRLESLLQRIEENTRRGAEAAGRPPQVNVSVGGQSRAPAGAPSRGPRRSDA